MSQYIPTSIIQQMLANIVNNRPPEKQIDCIAYHPQQFSCYATFQSVLDVKYNSNIPRLSLN